MYNLDGGVSLTVDGTTYNLPKSVLRELRRLEMVSEGSRSVAYFLDCKGLDSALLDSVSDDLCFEIACAFERAVYEDTGALEMAIVQKFLKDHLTAWRL